MKKNHKKENSMKDILIFLLVIVSVGLFIFTKAIAINHPPEQPTNLGPDGMTGGDRDVRERPTFSFTLIDEDSESVHYEIQISNTTDFSSLVLDYIGAPSDSGEFSFTVGEGELDGYIVGSNDMALENGPYFWRVKAIDTEEIASDWTYASESFAFIVGGSEESLPEISDVSGDVDEDSLVITWNTNEPSTTEIEYGTSEETLNNIEPDRSLALNHTITVDNLNRCTTYYYRVISVDVFGNSAESNELTKTFTAGCPGEASIIDDKSERVSKESGGTISLTSEGYGLFLTIPINFADADHDFQIEKLTKTQVFNAISKPNGFTEVGDYVYNLNAMEDTMTATSIFDEPLTISISYADIDIDGLDEETFTIYRHDDGEEGWVELSNCDVNTELKEVSCDTEHFSTFSIFGQQSGGSSSGSSGGSSTGGTTGSGSGGVAIIQSPDNSNITTKIDAVTSNSINYQTFSKNLAKFESGADVMKLQKYLNTHGFLVSESGAGSPGNETIYFGEKTKVALIKFQQAYAEFILKPYGLTKGTGFFGVKTREYINSHQE